MRTPHNRSSGFTLVEMIVVIVITGIIGGIVAVFLRTPVQGYVDSARRAELTNIADTAMRRMARDVRTAVPNSVRFSNCTAPCVEFLPTKDGGRYRANPPGNVLNFGVADGSFDVVGTPINFAAGDYIVVGSTQSGGAPPYLLTPNTRGVFLKMLWDRTSFNIVSTPGSCLARTGHGILSKGEGGLLERCATLLISCIL